MNELPKDLIERLNFLLSLSESTFEVTSTKFYCKNDAKPYDIVDYKKTHKPQEYYKIQPEKFEPAKQIQVNEKGKKIK